MLQRLIRSAVRNRAELATAAAFLLGWAVVTWAIVLFTRPVVWLVSLGVLLISLGGWELLYLVVRKGLYTLTRPERKKGQ
jgi:hypothetical protein